MKYLRFLLLLFGLLSVCSAAPAQHVGEWSLEQCIRYAWDNNISIRQQNLYSEQTKNLLLQSKMALLPTVGANASYNMSWGRSVDLQELQVIENKLSSSFGPSINASLDLFTGLQKVNAIKRNEADYAASQQEIAQMRNQISLEIARAYLQTLLSQESLTAAEKSRESVEQQRDRTAKLVAAGSQPYSNLLEVMAQLAAEEVQCVTARNNVTLAYLALRQLLDIAPDIPFAIAAPEIKVEVIRYVESVKSLYDMAKGMPQIRAAEYKLQSAGYDVAIARGRYFPTLSLSASYGSYFTDTRTEDGFWDQLHYNRSPSLGFSLRIPLFQNWSIVTGTKNAKLNRRIAQLELESRQNALYKEIQQATADATAAYDRYKASEHNVATMQESFRYTAQKFDVGSVTATDYTVAKNNLFKAQSEMLQSKYQYVFQVKIIDFYKGLPLTLNEPSP
ncbi:MAG: TolC family protein [Prevotellaceae bacterium]|jgi:outer membrane protein|nr:TolC family protein [Prevotellaceae bacterium]